MSNSFFLALLIIFIINVPRWVENNFNLTNKTFIGKKLAFFGNQAQNKMQNNFKTIAIIINGAIVNKTKIKVKFGKRKIQALLYVMGIWVYYVLDII